MLRRLGYIDELRQAWQELDAVHEESNHEESNSSMDSPIDGWSRAQQVLTKLQLAIDLQSAYMTHDQVCNTCQREECKPYALAVHPESCVATHLFAPRLTPATASPKSPKYTSRVAHRRRVLQTIMKPPEEIDSTLRHTDKPSALLSLPDELLDTIFSMCGPRQKLVV